MNELWVAIGEIKAGFNESCTRQWDNLTADRLIDNLSKIIPDNVLLWAMQYRHDLYKPVESAEKGMETARYNKDIKLFENAIKAFQEAAEAINVVVGDNKDILDPPKVVTNYN